VFFRRVIPFRQMEVIAMSHVHFRTQEEWDEDDDVMIILFLYSLFTRTLNFTDYWTSTFTASDGLLAGVP
jgi:hypothetical protein